MIFTEKIRKKQSDQGQNQFTGSLSVDKHLNLAVIHKNEEISVGFYSAV